MFEILNAGGWSMWILLITSIVGLTFIIDRAFALRTRKVLPPNLLEEVLSEQRRSSLSSERLDQLRNESPLGRVLAAGLKNVASNRQVMQESIEEAGRGATRQLERFLGGIATIASASPLMGLMGTVIGMIEIFGSQSGTGGNPQQLAHGIAIALYNTGFGLLIAIPCLIFYRYYRARVDHLVFEMEQQAIKLVEVVHGQRRT